MDKNSKIYQQYKNNAIQGFYDIKKQDVSYILSEEDVNLSIIIKTIQKYIKNGFPYIWNNKIIVNNEEFTEGLDNTVCYAFDFSNFKNKGTKLNTIRFCFIFGHDNTTPEIFKGKNTEACAFYMNELSNTLDDNRYGIILINFHNYLRKFGNTLNTTRFFRNLEEVVFHEIQHYYDNIIGIYYPLDFPNKIIDLEIWAEECYNYNSQYGLDDENPVNNILYTVAPTEQNAFTNSFITIMKYYIIDNKMNFDELKMIDFINKQTDYPFKFYKSYRHFKNLTIFKKYIYHATHRDLNNYFCLFNNIKIILKFDKSICNAFNTIFIEKYLNTTKASMDDIKKQLPNAFLLFMDNEIIPYTYKILKKQYYSLYQYMNDQLKTLINKYIN